MPMVPAACLRPRRMPLGLLMLSRGNLTEQQLRQALHAQLTAGSGKIGEWLRQLGFAEECDVASALAQQWSCPVMKTLPARIPDCPIPRHLLRTLRIAPVHVSKSARLLHMAFAGNIHYKALFSIEQMLDTRTEACLTTEKEIAAALERLGDGPHEGEKLFENCQETEERVRIVSNYTGALGAGEVRSFACGEYLWVRISAGTKYSDLLFPQIKTFSDIVPAS